ncbi:MAG: DUF6785 family protein [Phycisphaeraceae bacterium]
MSIRAVIIGMLLGLTIAAVDYFNGTVIRQVYLIGNQLPSAVFGTAVVLLLIWNPAVRGLGQWWVLRAGEIAVIVALALAVCGWPGSNFLRHLTTSLAMPAHLYKTQTSWQTARVMSYVPGGSPLLADGHVRDWGALARHLAGGESGPARRVWELLPTGGQAQVQAIVTTGMPDAAAKATILDALDTVLRRADFYQEAAFTDVALPGEVRTLLARRPTSQSPREVERLNRLLLDAAFGDAILPLPRGEGVLLAGGQSHPVATDLLIQGSSRPLGLTELPWGVWWPSLRLWLGVAVALSVAALCMALVVHPQWSRHELLPYPIARFLHEATEAAPHGPWPLVAQSRLFWAGFGLLIIVHLLNGLHAWFPGFISIPLQYDFSPLGQLFPNAVRMPGSTDIFQPRIFPSVIAFAFFLSTQVSFSLGVMGFVYLAVGALLIRQGISVASEGLNPGVFTLMVFGGYMASAATVLYVGRRYYLNVAGATLGGARHSETPAYAMWAGRGLALCAALAAVLLTQLGGLDWLLSVLLVALALLIFFVVSRIYAETGALMVQAGWAPAAMLLALFGVGGIGPTAYVVMAIAGIFFAIDTRETWMAYFVHGLHLTSTTGQTPPRRMAPLLLVMLLAGLAVALSATMWLQYNRGVNHTDRWAVEWVPAGTFSRMTSVISELSARDELASATARSGLERLAAFSPEPRTLWWIGLGAALVAGCSVARLRLSWWPLHPVLFLIWGTWAGYAVTISFFIGWFIKLSVVKVGGARSYQKVKPLMVGVIAGELLAALSWVMVGAIYYAATDLAPRGPKIFP